MENESLKKFYTYLKEHQYKPNPNSIVSVENAIYYEPLKIIKCLLKTAFSFSRGEYTSINKEFMKIYFKWHNQIFCNRFIYDRKELEEKVASRIKYYLELAEKHRGDYPSDLKYYNDIFKAINSIPQEYIDYLNIGYIQSDIYCFEDLTLYRQLNGTEMFFKKTSILKVLTTYLFTDFSDSDIDFLLNIDNEEAFELWLECTE